MFKPMLAGSLKAPFTVSPGLFPLLVSPKLDGLRATIQGGKVMSRSLKPHANKHIQKLLGNHPELEGLDGELICGDPADPQAFTKVGPLSAYDTKPEFTFWVFDLYAPGEGFYARYRKATAIVDAWQGDADIRMVPHFRVDTQDELNAAEQEFVSRGYEGAMLRSIHGPYKQGRSTLNEFSLIKLKRFVDEEGILIGMNEQMTNTNIATINALGHTERSTCKDGLLPAGTLGAMVVRSLEDPNLTFKIAPGRRDKNECQKLWNEREQHLGKIVKFRYFPTGTKDKPRFAQFVGFRDPLDMDGAA